MSSLKLKLYHSMPHAAREFLASVYGHKRNRFRYNDLSDRLIAEAAERESWSREQWKTYQENRLERVLHRAATKVPYYMQQWSERRRKGDRSSADVLDNWPVLPKTELRANNAAFLAEDCNPRQMYTEHTSGTSGTPINVFWSRECTLNYYAIFERRIRNWHGVNRHMRYVMLGGQLIVPVSQTKPPFWIRNKAMNQLYMSSYHLSDTTVEYYADAINDYEPEYIFGYASSMYSLALLLKKNKVKVMPVKCAVSNAEPLLLHQKALIEEVFSCITVNTYGMSELVAGGSTYASDDIILWPEVGMMDTYRFGEDTLCTEGESGRFVCTSLLNEDMPLIKYEVGDSGIVSNTDEQVHYKCIKEIMGRIDDLVITADGRRIGRLDTVFKSNLNITEAQIIQESLEDFTILLVPSAQYTDEDGQSIIRSLKSRIGEANVRIERTQQIERTNTGKFKAVVSKVKEK